MSEHPGETEFNAGITAVSQGEITSAFESFNRACAQSPDSARYQLYRAWARYHLIAAAEENVPSANNVKASCRATILSSLVQDRRFDAGFVLLGTILLGEGRHARARDCFLKALSINPDNAGARMGMDTIDS